MLKHMNEVHQGWPGAFSSQVALQLYKLLCCVSYSWEAWHSANVKISIQNFCWIIELTSKTNNGALSRTTKSEAPLAPRLVISEHVRNNTERVARFEKSGLWFSRWRLAHSQRTTTQSDCRREKRRKSKSRAAIFFFFEKPVAGRCIGERNRCTWGVRARTRLLSYNRVVNNNERKYSDVACFRPFGGDMADHSLSPRTAKARMKYVAFRRRSCVRSEGDQHASCPMRCKGSMKRATANRNRNWKWHTCMK